MAFNYNHSRTAPSQPMAEINTTPLVDVMLVLLVIFIITAPLFNQAVPIDLPKVDATRLNDATQIVHVAVDVDGKIFVDGGSVAFDAFGDRLRTSLVAGVPAPELHLQADRGTRYERVTAVMAVAQKIGITKIAFMTEAEANGKTQ